MKERGEPLRIDFVRDAEKIGETIRRAIQHALLQHKRAGGSISSWKDGQVVIIPPEEIPVEGPLAVGKFDKLVLQILGGSGDANISFNDLCQLLLRFGFEERIQGSHHMFRKDGVEEKINLQRDGSKAKAYQVRQVRVVIKKYKLGGES